MGKRALRFWDQLGVWLWAAGALLPGPRTWIALALASLLGLGATVYLATQHTVRVEINGWVTYHRTHQRAAQGVLRELGVTVHPEDKLELPSEVDLLAGAPIRLTVARPVILIHEGTLTLVRTFAPTVGEAIAAMDVVILPHDHLSLEGAPCTLDTPLPLPTLPSKPKARALLQALRDPVRLAVSRAVALAVQDGAIASDFYTTARTVGEALWEHGVIIYGGDRVFPGLEAEITPGLQVFIERAKPVVLEVGGTFHKTLRTRARTVSELLAAEEVRLGPQDYVKPAPETPISRDLTVAVVRVYDEYYVEETAIPFQERWEPDPLMEIDLREVTRAGREGAKRQRIRVRYENDREVARVAEEEWVARPPVDRIINYGTKIVLRTLETPDGPITYWRKIRVLATSYSASTAGVPVTASYYGFTRLGEPARKGVVAVDPRVIRLRQPVYVPGYGLGIAGDTGGAIKGRRIDLCYDDDNLVLWYRWVDIYLLPPVPEPALINWILPD
jgi:uncharacterized protein YabE (DUF348 family)